MNIIKICIVALLFSLSTLIKAKPNYATPQTKEMIEKMLKAHGGLEAWKNIPAIRFDNVMHNNYHKKNEFAWWIAHEVFEQKTRHVYQDWNYNDAKIGFDGQQVWSQNWKKANPTSSMLYFFYYFVNLPWLTQDDGVQLSEVTEFEWPGYGKKYYEIKMSYSKLPIIGKSSKDYFILYIDKDSYLLQGYQYAVGNKALLKSLGQPPERELFGPLWRIITKYTTVGGLVFPSAFRTMPEADERIVGNHVIMNIDITTPFDRSKLIKPKGAKIDFKIEEGFN